MFLKPIRKVLYVSSGQGVHDLRFVNLMKMAGWLVFYLRTDGMPNQKVDGVKVVEWVGNKFQISEINQQLFADSLLELEQSIGPDVIQIGPLVPTAAALSENLQTPVLGVSWSRDLLYDLDLSNWSTEIAINAINRSGETSGRGVPRSMVESSLVAITWSAASARCGSRAIPTPAAASMSESAAADEQPVNSTNDRALAAQVAETNSPLCLRCTRCPRTRSNVASASFNTGVIPGRDSIARVMDTR